MPILRNKTAERRKSIFFWNEDNKNRDRKHHICDVSKKFSEWYHKTNKT
jgi:hypothetical protein